MPDGILTTQELITELEKIRERAEYGDKSRKSQLCIQHRDCL